MKITSLKILNLKRNNITYFFPNFPEKLIMFEKFYLDDNYFIKIIDSSSLNFNSDLTIFYLQNRKISTLKEYYFRNVPNLICIYLSSNQIRDALIINNLI